MNDQTLVPLATVIYVVGPILLALVTALGIVWRAYTNLVARAEVRTNALETERAERDKETREANRELVEGLKALGKVSDFYSERLPKRRDERSER